MPWPIPLLVSSLIHEHINTQGRHSFVMPEAVVKGGHCARCEIRPMIRTEAITVSGPRHNRKTYVPRSPYRSGLPRFSVQNPECNKIQSN
jgi:hypothetical protein